MVNIRLLEMEDLPRLREIHEQFYKQDFPFPIEPNRKHLDRYIITDCDDNILIFGTLEVNAELVALSDLDADIKLRREAYSKLIAANLFGAQNYNLPFIYASATNSAMEKHLRHRGFETPKHPILIHKV
jgi:hypothetical protein